MTDERQEIYGAPQKSKRAIVRECLLAFLVMVTLVLLAWVFDIPNPNMLLITGLVAFTSIYGVAAGTVCGVVMVLYSLYFFSVDHSFLAFTMVDLQKIGMILLSIVLNLSFVGYATRIHHEKRERLIKINKELSEDNTVLEEASSIDSLTGLRNRFALRRDYEAYGGKDLCVMILDLDNFKSANDTRGHGVGDFILSSTGAALRKHFGQDHCYRYGGDEFLIIQDEMVPEVFANQLKAMQMELAKSQLQEHTMPIRFSAGYVYGKAEMQDDLRLMISHADNCLYKAKGQGKNRFIGVSFRREYAERLENSFAGVGTE